jgi:hypothetical protein
MRPKAPIERRMNEEPLMQNFFQRVVASVQDVYQKAEDLIEEEHELPLSQQLLNDFIERYVTENVDQIKDLHADIFDGWLRLFATVDFKGVSAQLYVDLYLVQLHLNKDTQELVFEQKNGTQVVQIDFNKFTKKIGFQMAMWFYRFKGIDPLADILSRLNILTVHNSLLHLDLQRWLAHRPKVMRVLRRVEINRAELRQDQLVLQANLNFRALFGRSTEERLLDEENGKG